MSALAYRRPKLSASQEKAVQLDLFSFLIKLRTRDVITPREAADILRASPDFVRDLIQFAGSLETFDLAAKGSRDRKGERKSPPEYRITVRSFLVYLASISRLSAEDWDDLLVTFVDKLDLHSLDRLLALATRRRDRLRAT